MKTTEQIKKQIDAYFNGESSLQQEEELREYFTTDKVAPELEKYRAIFGHFTRQRSAAETEPHNATVTLPQPTVLPKRRAVIGYTLMGIAAGIALLVTLMLTVKQPEKQSEILCQGTFAIIDGKCTDDPEKVSQVAIDAIDAIMQPANEAGEQIGTLLNANTNVTNEHAKILEQLETSN